MTDKERDINKSQKTDKKEVSQPGADEVFCVECGEIIKQRAEICPECGVRQKLTEDNVAHQQQDATPQQPQPTENRGGQLSDRRQYELEKIASNDKTTVAIVGFLISPIGYWMIGKKALAIVNFLTVNFFLLGPIIVPIHCYIAIDNAEDELRRSGVGGY